MGAWKNHSPAEIVDKNIGYTGFYWGSAYRDAYLFFGPMLCKAYLVYSTTHADFPYGCSTWNESQRS